MEFSNATSEILPIVTSALMGGFVETFKSDEYGSSIDIVSYF
jgi:hypothetical protein